MKAINPRTNEVEDCELLTSERETLVRFNDGYMVKIDDVQFIDEFDGFIDSVNSEAFPEMDTSSLMFWMLINIVGGIALIAVVYYIVKLVEWLFMKFI